MKLSVNQPAFLPWLGYFHRIMKSDAHVVLDHVQFEKNSFVNRNKIKTASGANWLTVPLITSGKFGDLAISKVEIFQDKKWQKRVTETIKQFYKSAPYFKAYFPELESLLMQEHTLLNDLLRTTNDYFFKALNIQTPIKYSSDLNVPGAKSELVLNICKHEGCTTYISGPLGRGYLDEGSFEKDGIQVVYHDFVHPQYKQLHGEFIPYMSVIDILFNEGEAVSEILNAIPLQQKTTA